MGLGGVEGVGDEFGWDEGEGCGGGLEVGFGVECGGLGLGLGLRLVGGKR